MNKKIAYGGILTSLTLLIIYFAGIAPSGKLALYAISSLPAAFMVIEFGAASAAAMFAAGGILSLLLLGNIPATIPYLIFFGYYSIVKYYIEKVTNASLEIVLKLLFFNTVLAASYFLYTEVFLLEINTEFTVRGWILAAALIVLQFVYLLYDYVFSRIIEYYYNRIRIIRQK
ncbi:MAG: hypothetical protein ACOZCL_02460 [Bacillota bacterium]